MRVVKSLLKNLLVLLIGCVVAGLVGEGLILAFFGEQPKFPRHVVGSSFGLRINEPRAHYRHKSADGTWWFQINGQGMRSDHDFPYAKPPGVKRIVSLGDSFTIGYEVNHQESFSSIVEERLNAKGYKVEVLNTGVSGYSNAEELLYLERELLKYSPDIVMLSYCSNDLEDNVRTNLFKLEDGKLVEGDKNYVPMGKIADILNRNPLANFLSERSNLFVFVKERATLAIKATKVANNMEAVEFRDGQAESNDPTYIYQRQLAVAILDRLYEVTRKLNIPLVLHSIPFSSLADIPGGVELVEWFPKGFDVNRPGILYLPAKRVLDPFVGKKELFNQRSHSHYNAFAHLMVGEALAQMIDKDVLSKERVGAAVANEAPKTEAPAPSPAPK